MMKWRRRVSYLGRFTLWHNGRRATELGRFTLWPKGRQATELGRFTLWHNSRRVTIQLFHRKLFMSNGSDGLHRNDFLLYHVRKTHPLPFHGVIITYYINTSEIPGFSVILKKSYFHREQSRYY